MQKLSVVIPVFNNETTIIELHERIVRSLSSLGFSFELILVDDGSSDSSWSSIEQIAAKDSKIKAIRLSRNFGQHAAIEAGLSFTNAEFISFMDADLQELPEELPSIFEPLLNKKCDIVIGTTKKPLRITSRIFHSFSSSTQNQNYPVTQRAFNQKVLNALRSKKSINVIYGPVTENLGFKKIYVPVSKNEKRNNGKSSYTFKSRLDLALNFLSQKIVRNMARFSLISLLVAVLFFIYGLISFIGQILFERQLAPGFNLIEMTLLAGFSTTFLILTVIGLVVGKIEEEFTNSPRYFIAEEINI